MTEFLPPLACPERPATVPAPEPEPSAVEGLRAPLTIKTCAELAGVHEHTVRRAIARGDLEAYRRRGSTALRVHPEAFEQWVYGERVEPDRLRPAPLPRTAVRASGAGSLSRLRAIEHEA
jgi:excisionase family DNA binding protein